jgi:hypothetical protein
MRCPGVVIKNSLVLHDFFLQKSNILSESLSVGVEYIKIDRRRAPREEQTAPSDVMYRIKKSLLWESCQPEVLQKQALEFSTSCD